ncbi:E3 ubiquitin-protein ligase MYLIP isoform X2 [Lingula anatina]|uniref:E3 ubiquitin-protein ligase MYLIP isoform X2 n=1 Tax=Lingula anatina TaxID=7574 RepID=A0A1S3JKB4_LINAN|nr:E3 ubiquitin-protein ligase MYLIP isoform X2 [Lingula anatina]|eukprot:XP_013410817.1 E3 ubiquitin-protein ligase MYLIP isoform X2 [Lingula anatina]
MLSFEYKAVDDPKFRTSILVCRHLFYLTVRDDFVNGILKLRSREQELDMAAHIAQAELGDLCKHSPHHCASYPSFCPETFRSCTDHLAQVAHRHEQLAGMKTNNAEYRMLQFAETAENFGVEFHQAKDLSTGQDLNIGVGPGGIILYSMQTNQVQFSIPYPTVQIAIHNGKDFHLTVIRDNGSQHTQGFRLVSQRAADALYRCVTEMHSFYRCDTVRNAVSGQFSRDLKGTLASLFNENTTLGKRYIFDIRRTCREVCDHARRVLYTTGRDVLRKPRAEGESVQDCHQCEGAACPLDKFDSQMEHQDSPYTQVEEEESLLCRVCMDANIDITFGPCCHTVCCHSCMRRLDHCPICRAPIESIQRIVPQEEMCTLEL